MADWIIFYQDGSTFSSDEGGPEDAPRWGVEVIATSDPDVGRMLYWDSEFYCWQEDQWIPHDRAGAQDYELNTKWPIRLRGYWIDRKRFFSEIYPRACNDPRLPEKNSYHRLEQRALEYFTPKSGG